MHIHKDEGFRHVYVWCPREPGSPLDAADKYMQHPDLVTDWRGYVHTVDNGGGSACASKEWLAVPDPDSSVHYFWSAKTNSVQWQVPSEVMTYSYQ